MLSHQQIEQFHQQGFLVVPQVLKPAEVTLLRSFFEPMFEQPANLRRPGDVDGWLVDIYNRYPEVRWLLFHQPSHEIFRALLGEDFVILRDASALYEFYSSWHKDSGGLDLAGETFHLQDDFLMVQVCYTLQDNTYLFGGGLDVEPATHLIGSDPFVLNQSHAFKNIMTVPSRAGDLIVFHFRLHHRATPRLIQDSPGTKKMAIFQPASANRPYVKTYNDYLLRRPAYAYMKNSSFAEEVLHSAEEMGLNLV